LEAAKLMRDRLEADLADSGITRVSYRIPAGCRNGGPLDIRPRDPTFP
jgi:hypothetical protein